MPHRWGMCPTLGITALWNKKKDEYLKNRSIQYEYDGAPKKKKIKSFHPIYPTPPLGQDMTQGQFLSGV